MKKHIAALVVTLFTALLAVSAVYAQEDKDGKFTIDGLVKTGFYWQEVRQEGKDPAPTVKVHNNDDSGGNRGRFRVNMQYEIGDFGFKTRIQWDNWGQNYPEWSYAFGYGNFLDKQITVSLGKMGSSPWGTGGPEMWKELETSMGVRVEIKPNIVPGLNAGFVLNDFNNGQDGGHDINDATFWEILRETVIGASYDHDYFGVRFAYRLDSVYDKNASNGARIDGDDMIYRLEERVLKNYLPGFQIWANGQYEGIGTEADDDRYKFENWLYVQYAPELFTAQLRLGYDIVPYRTIFHARPSFYWNFFDGFLSAGTSFEFAQDFDKKMYEDSPYLYWGVEPKVWVTFGNMTVTLAYHYRNEYKYHTEPPVEEIHWLNLRFALTF
jgi:hypothetical protein